MRLDRRDALRPTPAPAPPPARALALTLTLALALPACGPTLPPFSRPASPTPDAAAATITIAWPPSSCESAGHYAVMTSDGRFLGTVASGTRLVTSLPPGPAEIVAWDPVMEESASPAAPTAVLLRLDLRAGATQPIALRFGEWHSRGPRKIFRTRRFGQACVDDRAVLLPATAEDDAALATIAPDREAGQRWLDASGRPAEHVAAARAWADHLAPGARAIVVNAAR